MPGSPTSPSPPLVVYKIGGSLFDLPELPHVLRRVLAQRPAHAALLVAGGGAAAEAVREWDRRHALGDEAAHALALKSMELGAALLGHFFPQARLVRSARQVQLAVRDCTPAILCADCFIAAEESHGHPPLEHSWRVTSDSIAAWTARVLAAAELVLLKSVAAPTTLTLSEAARAGFVDESFPQAAAYLGALGWVNARSGEPQIERWPLRSVES